jgi:diketogulonate reductase-like aldo/keto reductase
MVMAYSPLGQGPLLRKPALKTVADKHGVDPAAVALAWVQGRRGVASTIIGARRMDQLDQNLAALDLELTAGQIARLDQLSKPALGFPMQFLNVASMFSQGGTTVNGEKSTVWPLAPKSDAERY